VAWLGAFGKGAAVPGWLFPGVSHSNNARKAATAEGRSGAVPGMASTLKDPPTPRTL